MGDLNDDPVSPSLTKVLNAKGDKADVKRSGLYNPWVGTQIRYRYNCISGCLGLFDQIVVSEAWPQRPTGLFHRNATIFNRQFLVQPTGKYKGYPMRTWDGTTYNYGYSDHFRYS